MADIARTRAFAPAPPWRLIVVALVLIALVLAALFVVGSQRKVAPPFGPARNGEIVYDSAGDLYVGEPDDRCEPVACRRSRGGQRARLLAGRHPGRVLPECWLLSDGPSTSLWSTPDGSGLRMVRLGAARPTSTVGQLDAGQQAHGGHPCGADGTRAAWSSSTSKGSEPPRRLAPDMDVSSPAFRPPNGQEIAFRAIVDDKYGVYVMNADGTGIERSLSRTSRSTWVTTPTTWSTRPTGSASSIRATCRQLAAERRVLPAVGGERGRLGPACFESVNEAAWTGVPTVSPDGRWVSYWSVLGNSGNQQIRVAPADGSGPAIGIGPAMSDFFPWSWAPDSSKILMMPEDGSTTSAYLIDPEGGAYEHRPV